MKVNKSRNCYVYIDCNFWNYVNVFFCQCDVKNFKRHDESCQTYNASKNCPWHIYIKMRNKMQMIVKNIAEWGIAATKSQDNAVEKVDVDDKQLCSLKLVWPLLKSLYSFPLFSKQSLQYQQKIFYYLVFPLQNKLAY